MNGLLAVVVRLHPFSNGCAIFISARHYLEKIRGQRPSKPRHSFVASPSDKNLLLQQVLGFSASSRLIIFKKNHNVRSLLHSYFVILRNKQYISMEGWTNGASIKFAQRHSLVSRITLSLLLKGENNKNTVMLHVRL